MTDSASVVVLRICSLVSFPQRNIMVVVGAVFEVTSGVKMHPNTNNGERARQVLGVLNANL